MQLHKFQQQKVLISYVFDSYIIIIFFTLGAIFYNFHNTLFFCVHCNRSSIRVLVGFFSGFFSSNFPFNCSIALKLLDHLLLRMLVFSKSAKFSQFSIPVAFDAL